MAKTSLDQDTPPYMGLPHGCLAVGLPLLTFEPFISDTSIVIHMDPLSISAAVAGIISSCLTTATTLNRLRSSYLNASLTIGSICSEMTVISASLAQIQNYILTNTSAVSEQFQTHLDLKLTFDIALTGCMVTFSCLEEEANSLVEKATEGREFNWADKVKVVWKEDNMKELLQQLRGQQTAISVLLQSLQMYGYLVIVSSIYIR